MLASFFLFHFLRLSFTFQKELPYHLLSDRNRVLIGALGAGEGGRTKRSHFVFDKGGMLVDKKMPVKPNDRSVSKKCSSTAFPIDLHATFS
jgi:peroxiredoxin